MYTEDSKSGSKVIFANVTCREAFILSPELVHQPVFPDSILSPGKKKRYGRRVVVSLPFSAKEEPGRKESFFFSWALQKVVHGNRGGPVPWSFSF